MKTGRTMLLMLLTAMLFTFHTQAQTVYEVNKEKSKLEIQGTSSIHDWEMLVEDYQLEAYLTTEEGNTKINRVSFSCKVEDISADSRIMDGKAHDALKEDDHPRITFSIKENASLQIEDGKTYIKGSITIAGVTRKIQFPVSIHVISDSTFQVKGNLSLKMTDYNVTPPKAMMGALETGDEVTIDINLVLEL
ncbi:MAG: YceI family protein [Bacteroidales bacterium]